jgi:hypothetical protein
MEKRVIMSLKSLHRLSQDYGLSQMSVSGLKPLHNHQSDHPRQAFEEAGLLFLQKGEGSAGKDSNAW